MKDNTEIGILISFLALGFLPFMTFWIFKLIPSLFCSYLVSIVIFLGGILIWKRLPYPI